MNTIFGSIAKTWSNYVVLCIQVETVFALMSSWMALTSRDKDSILEEQMCLDFYNNNFCFYIIIFENAYTYFNIRGALKLNGMSLLL